MLDTLGNTDARTASVQHGASKFLTHRIVHSLRRTTTKNKGHMRKEEELLTDLATLDVLTEVVDGPLPGGAGTADGEDVET